MRVGTALDCGRPMSVIRETIAVRNPTGLSSVTLGQAHSLSAPTELDYLAAPSESVNPAPGAVQNHFLSGRIAEATAAVLDELVPTTALVGDTDHIRRRLTALHEAGVTLVNITPMATDPAERLDAVETVAALGKEIS